MAEAFRAGFDDYWDGAPLTEEEHRLATHARPRGRTIIFVADEDDPGPVEVIHLGEVEHTPIRD